MSAPIFRFNQQREDLIRTVVERVVHEARDPVLLLNDAAYHEIRRLEASRGDTTRWRKLARSLGGLDRHAATERLRELADHHARDVDGNFDPRVYAFASRVLPVGLSLLLRPQALVEQGLSDVLRGDALAERIRTSGPIEKIQKLSERGTLVYVPTHLSNLDSPVFAYALESARVPPVTYGAGKNLFTNPILSFFMRNLGAYRVDRRLRHELYKLVLKAYSCVLIERGFHSLFFPGGTRSRSGGVERRLKLGLAGTGLEAFARSGQRVFFVPATINYMLTLEAETLVDDHLKDAGKARYIIEDDESTRLGRVTQLVNQLVHMEGSCAVRFGEPVDPFGNSVDERGDSYDRQGRRVDPRTYVEGDDGKVRQDPVRDALYTRELGEVVMDQYLRDTVAMTTHVVATAAFARLRVGQEGKDVFALVRRADEVFVPMADMLAEIERVQARLATLEGRGAIQVANAVRGAHASELLGEAERALNGYHANPVFHARGDTVALLDPKVLLYYQNRLAAHGVGWMGGIR